MRANVSACCDGRTKKNRRVQPKSTRRSCALRNFTELRLNCRKNTPVATRSPKAFAAFANSAAIRLEVTRLSPHDPSLTVSRRE
jgi:hypothetical protein